MDGSCAAEQTYLDHAATTPPRPEVIEAMAPYLQRRWGNPSSLHVTGVHAMEGVERAREQVAALLGVRPDELVFTSGGTEADNHALVGAWLAHRDRGDHIITTAIEHHAVLHSAEFLHGLGVVVTYLPVDSTGLVDPEGVRRAITEKTILVSVMHANNEIGTIEPIAEIGAICRERGVLFHTDAVQTVGHVPINVREMSIDLLSLSAHKLYGPKGVGALFVREGVELIPFMHGGGQESHRRGGTENVPGIVGLGEAARLAAQDMPWEIEHNTTLRDALIAGVLARVPDVTRTGHPTQRLPNSASFCVAGVEGESVLLGLDSEGIAVSTGSACTSGSLEPSHVLLACGIPPHLARGSVRVTVGRENTEQDVMRFIEVFPAVVARLRETAAVSSE